MDEIFNYKPDEEEDFYKILGSNELSSVEQITAEYKARVLGCHPDKHPGDTEKEKQFQLLQQAKDVLCDNEKRKKYDQWRNSGISMSFKQWCALRDSVHTSMHWGSVKSQPMLESEKTEESHHSTSVLKKTDMDNFQISSHSGWTRDESSEMLRKFRNYEI